MLIIVKIVSKEKLLYMIYYQLNSSLISSALSNMKGDTNYEDVNRSLSSVNDFMNNSSSSNDKPFYVNSIDTSMVNNTGGKC